MRPLMQKLKKIDQEHNKNKNTLGVNRRDEAEEQINDPEHRVMESKKAEQRAESYAT